MAITRFLKSSITNKNKSIYFSGRGNYWINLINLTGQNFTSLFGSNSSVAVNASNNIFYNDGNKYFVKLNQNGYRSWVNTLNLPDTYVTNIVADNAGSSYVRYGLNPGDYYHDTSSGLTKLSSSGSILWQKNYAPAANCRFLTTGKPGIDPSNNVYITGQWRDSAFSTGGTAVIMKINSSGVTQWAKTLLPGVGNLAPYQSSISLSGNIYVGGIRQITLGSNPVDAFIVKYDSSGNLLWQRGLSNTIYVGAELVETDSFDNVYAAVMDGIGVSTTIVKYSSTGTLLWQRKLTGLVYFDKFAVDATGNVYVTGTSDGSAPSGFFGISVLKYDTNGVLQWQRLLASGVAQHSFISLTSAPDMVITYNTQPNSYETPLTVTLPNDGSLTKTVTYASGFGATNVTYMEGGDFVDSPGTLSSYTSFLSVGTITFTETTTAYTVSPITHTETRVAW